MIILWTDYFVYFLFLSLIGIGIGIYRSPLWASRFKVVVKQPLSLAAFIILIFYSSLALLDSIHFSNHDNVSNAGVSLLDKMLSPLGQQTEKTYSAPFAIYSFAQENQFINNKMERSYPRLKYAGYHLKNASDKAKDIRHRLMQTVLQTTLLSLALSIVLLILFKPKNLIWDDWQKKILQGKAYFPWRTFIGVQSAFIFLIVGFINFGWTYHIMGTNQVGEDVLYQSLKSIRTGFVIGLLSTLLSLPFAIGLGVVAGYFKGWIDDVIQYIYTTLNSIPSVLLIAASVLIMQAYLDQQAELASVMQRADLRLFALCAILGITSWTGLCRLLRAETLKISQLDFIHAAKTLGVSNTGIIYKHLLPNMFHLILITLALDFSGLVLAEAVLSYVGVGVDPSTYSWGMMINSARLEMARVPLIWWSLTCAFIFMFILVLAANIFSDALRDALDPRFYLRENK